MGRCKISAEALLTNTLERFAASIPNNTATMAALRSISRWNKHNLDASSQSFVGNEGSEVKECPRIRQSTFLLATRLSVSSFSNPAQVFQSNSRLGCQCFTNKVLTDDVVDMFLKPLFLPRQPLRVRRLPGRGKPGQQHRTHRFKSLRQLRLVLRAIKRLVNPRMGFGSFNEREANPIEDMKR